MKTTVKIFVHFIVVVAVYIIGVDVGRHSVINTSTIETNKHRLELALCTDKLGQSKKEYQEVRGLCTEIVHSVLSTTCPEVYNSITHNENYTDQQPVTLQEIKSPVAK